MARRVRAPRLSAGELEIMQLLWRAGPVTLAEAHAGMGRPVGYTTVQTRLNRLVAKHVVRRSTDRPARYSAAIAQGDVSARHLDLLLERVSGGSVVPLVAHLVRDRNLAADEIAELRRLVDDAERKLRGTTSKRGQKS